MSRHKLRMSRHTPEDGCSRAYWLLCRDTSPGIPSSYIGWQSTSSFDYNIGFTRTNDVLPTTYTGKGTSISGYSTKVDNEKKVGNKEGEGGVNKGNEEGAENEEGSKTNNDPI
ncbi:hypothetical protein J1N35_010490 [Gossypium stocksii]|uniref:Uncharacterized protein n=1 Tax=Gossypium stocksii TaxID=47602 RepID=A0A9D4AAK7_9ROSI|nr:hypothetical protein J1N35_010490 [Gossypium stocksii]